MNNTPTSRQDRNAIVPASAEDDGRVVSMLDADGSSAPLADRTDSSYTFLLSRTIQTRPGGCQGCCIPRDGPRHGMEMVAINADGTWLITAGGADMTAKVWNSDTGACLHTLRGHGASVDAVAMSADARIVATGTAAGRQTVCLWDAATGSRLGSLSGHTDSITALALSALGERLATASRDGSARLWDTSRVRLVHTLSGHTGPVMSVALSADGRLAATGSTDRSVRVWNGSSGQCLHVLRGHRDIVPMVALSADGRVLASAGNNDATARVWDTESGGCRHVLGVPSAASGAASVKPAAPVAKQTESMRRDSVLRAGLHAVLGVSLDAPGSMLVVPHVNNLVRVWDTRSGSEMATVTASSVDVGRLTRHVKVTANGFGIVGSDASTGRVKIYTAEAVGGE